MRSTINLAALSSMLVLAACGGGGGGGTTGGASSTALSIKGTAARGAAIAVAPVEVKCDGGTATTTTLADGSYTVTLASGALPCLLKVGTAAGDLFSVAAGSGTSVTSNITPVSHLIVARLAGKDPATYYASFGAADVAALTAAAVDAAHSGVVAMLRNNGIDASALGNLVTSELVAAHDGNAGNAIDHLLDALNARLGAAGVTLSQFASKVLQTSVSTGGAPAGGTPEVAVDVALQPSAASCPALRSGTYRVVVPQFGLVGKISPNLAQTATVDAIGLMASFADGTSTTLIPTSGTPCHFTDAAGAVAVVSRAGILAFNSEQRLMGIGFPEQALTVAELAGDWNMLGYDHVDASVPLAPVAATLSVTNAGVITFTTRCPDSKTCAPSTDSVTLVANGAGGFDVVRSATDKSRLFAFRAGGGEMMLVGVGADGTIAVGTRVRTLSLPTVGDVLTGWNVGSLNSLVAGAYQPTAFDISEYQNTVTSVDTANAAYTRSNVLNFTGPVTRPESLTVNKVAGNTRPGYIYREPAIVTTSAGVTSTVRDFVALPLRGMGMTAVGVPAPSAANADLTQFSFAVAKP